MKNAIIFSLSIIGMLGGLVAAYVFGMERKAQPPVFPPVSSPFDSAIYANGIIESDQANASNINVFPEISGPITGILVHEGQTVSAGTLMMTIDDSVQKATAAQLVVQTEAAQALLDELKAEPRQETLAIAKAQGIRPTPPPSSHDRRRRWTPWRSSWGRVSSRSSCAAVAVAVPVGGGYSRCSFAMGHG